MADLRIHPFGEPLLDMLGVVFSQVDPLYWKKNDSLVAVTLHA